MRGRFWVFMLCAALLLSGCGAVTFSGVTGKAAKAEDRMEEAAGETGTAEQVTAKIEETASEEAAEAEEAVEKAGTGEMAQEAGEKKPADNEAETKENEALEEDRSAEKAAEQSSEEKDQKKSEKKKSEKKKDEKKAEEEKASEEKELEPQYIPDGFTPYGNYVLVYDSGFEVKTRYSAAGLTYYWESEEFYFRLNKDLPDMTRGIAHILFNTEAPMDPDNTEGEEFPYSDPYVIYINLDDGSYYEVYRDSLDLEGRVFVRDVFEFFRDRWGDSF